MAVGGGGLWYRPRRHPKRPRGVSPLVCQPSGQDGPLACWAAERSRSAGRVPRGSPSYLPTLSSPAGFVFKAQTYRTCPAEHLSAFFFSLQHFLLHFSLEGRRVPTCGTGCQPGHLLWSFAFWVPQGGALASHRGCLEKRG